VTALRASRPRNLDSYPRQGTWDFFFKASRQALWPIDIPIRWIVGEPSPGIERLGREFDNSPACSVEAKTEWLYTSSYNLQICVHSLHRYRLTFLTSFTNNPIIKLYAGNIFNPFYQLHKPGMFLNKRHTTFNNNNNNNNNNAHTSECSNVKIQNVFHERKKNITFSTNCKYRTGATLYTLETWFLRYVIVKTLHKVYNKYNNNDNNNNNKNIQFCVAGKCFLPWV